METVLDTLNSGWGYSIGGIIIVVATGYWVYKKLNTPSFMVKQIRRRNQKEMKKLGTETSEAMNDLDRLLDSVEAYATKKGMTGSAMSQLLAPLQKVNDSKSGINFYPTMVHIAKSVGDNNLANILSKKSKQVKSNSPLMAGLLKRAGV
jgi:aspartate ammonia-lyase